MFCQLQGHNAESLRALLLRGHRMDIWYWWLKILGKDEQKSIWIYKLTIEKISLQTRLNYTCGCQLVDIWLNVKMHLLTGLELEIDFFLCVIGCYWKSAQQPMYFQLWVNLFYTSNCYIPYQVIKSGGNKANKHKRAAVNQHRILASYS